MTANMPGIMARPGGRRHTLFIMWDRSVRDSGSQGGGPIRIEVIGRAACTICRMRRFLVVLGVVALAITGCSAIEDQIDDSVNEVASEALAAGVEARLAEAGIELEEDPNCDTDLERDGTTLSGTATCDAVTVEGRSAHATFDGRLSSSGCSGSVTIEVDGETVVEGREVPDCSVQL